MSKYLITPSLLTSWQFYLKREDNNKEEFLNTLKKNKIEPNKNMQRGLDYEDLISSILHYNNKSDDLVINEIIDIIKDGLWQEPVMQDAAIHGINVLLYGRTDTIKENTIYDIKRTSHYYIGKYINSIQHDLYMLCSGLTNFKYLISTGDNLYIEEYNFTNNSKDNIINIIDNFLGWLSVNDLLAVYFENWKCKY